MMCFGRRDLIKVLCNHVLWIGSFIKLSRPNQENASTQIRDRLHIVTNKENGATIAAHRLNFGAALLLKRFIANCKHFIKQQNFRLEMRGKCERKTQIHSRRIVFNGRVEKSTHFAEGHDIVKVASDLSCSHTENCAVEE